MRTTIYGFDHPRYTSTLEPEVRVLRVRDVTLFRRILSSTATLLLLSALAARADAACNVSGCDASALISNPSCCTVAGCTIDTLTVTGPTCTFDFGTRNLTISGTVAAQGRTITLMAKSVTLTGLIDVRGPGGAAAGNVTIVTTGLTGLAYSQQGGNSAIINASSTAGAGGRITIRADGPVAFSKGSVTASGGPAAAGGVIDVSTTAGDINVQIALSANQGTLPPAGTRGGEMSFRGPGNFTLGGSGRLTADLGSISVNVPLLASFADGSVVQSNLGGDITMITGSLSVLGELRAGDDFGSIDLTASNGPMTLQRLSEGLTVGVGGSVSLTTESRIPDGTLTMDSPIDASGSTVDIASAGDLTISKKISTTGILDSGAGEVSIAADGDVHVTKAIVASDVYSAEDIGIDAGGDVTIEGNVESKGGLDADGGSITVTAGGAIAIQGDVSFNTSGADASSAGGIDVEAGRNLTIGPSAELIANGSPEGVGGTIVLRAGIDEFGIARVAGDFTLQGTINANGHGQFGGAQVAIDGCTVNIASGSSIDVTGDTGSTNVVTARTGLAIAGQLRASGANVLTFPEGSTPSLAQGTFVPARSAGACTDGTITANGCVRAPCTGENSPPGCLDPCPQCGDNQVQFPETCDVGAGGPFCSGSDFCDDRCRIHHCTDTNPCSDNACDPAVGCTIAYKPNGFACNDNTVCNGLEACQAGLCVPTPGSIPNCGSDGNPCTVDGCNDVTGCFHSPVPGNGFGVPGCDDGNPCTGAERCVGTACQAGTLVTCQQPLVCNPANGQCEGAGACQSAAECDDNNPCTDDVCNVVCSNPPKTNGANCDDGDLCNGVRACQGGVCQPATPVVCNDNDVCTTDSCNPSTGLCEASPVPGCCDTPAACNDGDACTTDGCSAHACTHVAIACVDNDVCTNDVCDSQLGCQHVADPTCCTDASTCNDNNPCTDDACVGNRCTNVASGNCCSDNNDCTDIDHNPCTTNGPCDLATRRCGGPTPSPGAACGTTCNPATCQGSTGSTCVPDAPTDCTDNNPCTTDLCSDEQGCTHTPITDCCLSSSQCNDNDVCTADACDLDRNGCDHPVPDPTCTPCSGTDPFECGPRCSTACVAGRCQDVVPNCDDNNPCTDDTCDQASGCTHTPKNGTGVAGCDDGQACNGAEQCVAGTCQVQPVLDCDDGDVCTDDTCADADGCKNDQKSGFPSILCRLEDMHAKVLADTTGGTNPRARTRMQKKLEKLSAKVGLAQSAAGSKCAKAKRLLTAAAKQLRSLQRTANRLAGRQLSPALATALAQRAGEAASKCDETKLGLGC